MKKFRLFLTMIVTVAALVCVVSLLLSTRSKSIASEKETVSLNVSGEAVEVVAAQAEVDSSVEAEAQAAEEDAEAEVIARTAQADTQAEVSDVQTTSFSAQITTAAVTSNGALDATEFFTERDLTQNADLSSAAYITVSDGDQIEITEEGIYVLSGTASEASIIVNADKAVKVQLVLIDLHITNTSDAAIYVKSADKVFVTTSGDSSLSVTGTFEADGETNVDGVIFSKEDLTLNGTATLSIESSDNAVVSKDDLKITGGTYIINAGAKGFEANDSIRIAGGSFTITCKTDAFHAENDEDDTLGYIYICGGDFYIDAFDDAFTATSILQVDGGNFVVDSVEGMEATYVQINGGDISLTCYDDGINAAAKSYSYYPTVEINGGNIVIVMSSGDTDAIDANGDIYVNGGTINITGVSSFDYDNQAYYNGGTIIVNGQQYDYIPSSMMGGGGRGGRW